MIRYENECVGCAPDLPCLGAGCPNRNVRRLYCDQCDCEAKVLYEYDGDELCEECLLDRVPKLE